MQMITKGNKAPQITLNLEMSETIWADRKRFVMLKNKESTNMYC